MMASRPATIKLALQRKTGTQIKYNARVGASIRGGVNGTSIAYIIVVDSL